MRPKLTEGEHQWLTNKEVKTVTVRNVATKLKIEPKWLRAIMRANGKSAKDGRYEWKEGDASLDKIAH